MRCLREFQVEALRRIAAGNLYLAAKPGSGKTAVAVHAAHAALYETFSAESSVLVVTPKRVVPQFAAEAVKWGLQLTFSEVMGKEDRRLAALASPADVYVTSHDHFPWVARRRRFDFVVFDEASRLRKGGRQGSVGWKALAAMNPRRLMLMSGSPRPGTVHELYAPVTLLDRGQRLGKTLGGFRAAYMEPHKTNPRTGQVYSWRLRHGMEEALYSRIADLFYAVSPDLGLTFTEIDRWVELPGEVARECQRLYRELVADFDWAEITAASAGVAAGKLKQLCSGQVFDDDGAVAEVHDAKLSELRDLIEEMDGEPLMIVCWYTHERARLLREIPGLVDITTERGLAAAKAGLAPLALIHPQSAAHGIDGLQQHYSAMVFYTLPDSYEYYDQVMKRIVRDGQRETVRVFRIVAGNGIADEKTLDALEAKRAGQERFYEFLTQ